MIPKKALEKAIEGGFRGQIKTSVALEMRVAWEAVALDPNFWRSLGKALGWTEKEEYFFAENRWSKGWHNEAMKFYDLILTGGDTEKFWQELLK